MNKWTHFLIKISLALYSRNGWCWLCVREWAEDGDRLLYWPKVLLNIAALLPHLGWVAQPWVTESPKPSVSCWLSIQHLVSNWLEPPLGTWLYNCLMPSCFHCSSTYLHRCISWLTARSRVNMLHIFKINLFFLFMWQWQTPMEYIEQFMNGSINLGPPQVYELNFMNFHSWESFHDEVECHPNFHAPQWMGVRVQCKDGLLFIFPG